jgi:predicted RNA binding protein YcfA (HicA-like mRNA interferase family)
MNWYKRIITAALPAYTLNELTHKLRMFGVEFARGAGGDHAIFVNMNNGNRTTIPMGPGTRIINPETMKQMLVHLDIPWGIFKTLPKSPKRKEMEQIEPHLPWRQQAKEKPSEPKVPEYMKQPWYIKQQKEYGLA